MMKRLFSVTVVALLFGVNWAQAVHKSGGPDMPTLEQVFDITPEPERTQARRSIQPGRSTAERAAAAYAGAKPGAKYKLKGTEKDGSGLPLKVVEDDSGTIYRVREDSSGTFRATGRSGGRSPLQSTYSPKLTEIERPEGISDEDVTEWARDLLHRQGVKTVYKKNIIILGAFSHSDRPAPEQVRIYFAYPVGENRYIGNGLAYELKDDGSYEGLYTSALPQLTGGGIGCTSYGKLRP